MEPFELEITNGHQSTPTPFTKSRHRKRGYHTLFIDSSHQSGPSATLLRAAASLHQLRYKYDRRCEFCRTSAAGNAVSVDVRRLARFRFGLGQSPLGLMVTKDEGTAAHQKCMDYAARKAIKI